MEDPKQSQNTLLKQLLRDTLTLLCKNTLVFNRELSIEGLLGLTVDKNEIILVSIAETISKNANDLEDMLEPCQMERYSPGQAKLKGKKKRMGSGRTGILANGLPRADQNPGNVCPLENIGLLPDTVKSKSEAMTIQVDFDFERIEVKEEQGLDDSPSYVGYGTLPLEEDQKRSKTERQDYGGDDEDDCFLIEPLSNVVQSRNESQSNFPDVQNDFKVFEQNNVDSFMSVDQEIFREMFQTDFASNALSSYDVEGPTNQDFDEASGSKSRRRVQRRRSNFSKADGGVVGGVNFPRTSGIHRRGYRFHCRYGYSSRILHQCTQCSATFTMSSNLGRHMATMHNVNGDGGHQFVFCPVCQKQFSRSDNLARHLKQVHKHPSAAAPALQVPPALLSSAVPGADP